MNSISLRLFLGLLMICSLVFWFASDRLLSRIERQYFESVEETMVDVSYLLAETLSFRYQQQNRFDLVELTHMMKHAKRRVLEARIYSMLKTRMDMDVYVVDAKGVVLYDSLHPNRVGQIDVTRDVSLCMKGKYGARSTREDQNDPTSSIMYVAAPILVGKELVGVVSVAKAQGSSYLFRERTKHWIVKTLGVFLVAMLFILFLWIRWSMRPVRQLTAYAKAIERGERPELPKVKGSELKSMRDAFEKMIQSLEQRDHIEHYIQTLTHELKSPVSAIRGASELLREKMSDEQRNRFLNNIQSEANRLHGLLDQLLLLVSLEHQTGLDERVEIDLSSVVKELEFIK